MLNANYRDRLASKTKHGTTCVGNLKLELQMSVADWFMGRPAET
jgi:hypothetical protein